MPGMGMVGMDAAGERSEFRRLTAKVSGLNVVSTCSRWPKTTEGLENTCCWLTASNRVRLLAVRGRRGLLDAGRGLMAVLIGE